MKKNKLLIAILFCLSLNLAFIPNANAILTYQYFVYGYHYATIEVDNYTYLSSPYFSNTVNAIYSWNHCGLTSRNISPNTSSPNKVYQLSTDETYAGQYQALVIDSSYAQTRTYFATKFKITLNTNKMPTSNTEQQGAIAHELGHALGLDHNENQVEPKRTLMRPSAEIFADYYTPQPYDVDAVNLGWPCW